MKNKRGFSLPEILIIVAVIGVLLAIGIPLYFKQVEIANETADLTNMRTAEDAILAKYNRREISAGTFYWDPENATLIDATNPKKIPAVGKGTARVGSSDNARTGYAANTNVKNAALLITFTGVDQTTGDTGISFSWIQASSVSYFYHSDYKYTRASGGWRVELNTSYSGTNSVFGETVTKTTKGKTSYAPILDEAFGLKVTTTATLFNGCTNMTSAPDVPKYVVNATRMFYGCTSLGTVSIMIPDTAENISQMFNGCTRMTGTITVNTNKITSSTYYVGFLGSCARSASYRITLNGSASTSFKNRLKTTAYTNGTYVTVE